MPKRKATNTLPAALKRPAGLRRPATSAESPLMTFAESSDRRDVSEEKSCADPDARTSADSAHNGADEVVSITVRKISGEGYTFELGMDSRVFDLRKAIEDKNLCPMPCQQLLWNAKPLARMNMKVAKLASSEVTLVVGAPHGIYEIYINTGDVVDFIELKQRDGTSYACGRKGGGEREPFLLEAFEYIVEVAWWSSAYYGPPCLKGVRFKTNTGRTSVTYGHEGHDWNIVRADVGKQISGLTMRGDPRGYVSDISNVMIQ